MTTVRLEAPGGYLVAQVWLDVVAASDDGCVLVDGEVWLGGEGVRVEGAAVCGDEVDLISARVRSADEDGDKPVNLPLVRRAIVLALGERRQFKAA